MKKLCLIIVVVLLSYNADNAIGTTNNVSTKGILDEKIITNTRFTNSSSIPLYNLDTLSFILGYKESGNNYKAIHRVTKCMGKYQFTHATLRTLKINTTTKEFLSDSLLQEEAFKKLVEYEYQFLRRNNVLKYVGTKSVDGIPITVEGLIMASHLCGPVSVYDYIVNKNKENRVITWGKQRVRVYKTDLNGTKIQNYLRYL